MSTERKAGRHWMRVVTFNNSRENKFYFRSLPSEPEINVYVLAKIRIHIKHKE